MEMKGNLFVCSIKLIANARMQEYFNATSSEQASKMNKLHPCSWHTSREQGFPSGEIALIVNNEVKKTFGVGELIIYQ